MHVRALSTVILLTALAACTDSQLPTTPPTARQMAVTEATYDCTAQSQIPQSECEALVALYNSTNGPGWTYNGGWLATNEPCGWYNVGCAAGHVASLDLLYNQLSGPIPVELGNLSNLLRLNLFGNQLSGPIPAELGNLGNLLYLGLFRNQLTGSIPAALGNLSNLVILDLHLNELSGPIPAELGNLSNLSILILNDNQLSGPIPAELGNLSNLYSLNLTNNQLSGLLLLPVAVLAGSIEYHHNCHFTPGNPDLYMPDVPDYRAADLDHDGQICDLAFTADPGTVATDTKSVVNDLLAEDALNGGQANALTQKVDQALNLASKGHNGAAVAILRGLIQQVNDLTADGVLTEAQADELTSRAEILITLVQDQGG